MQSHIIKSWLNKRGITDDVIALFNLSVYDHPQIGECLKIPYSEHHSKYRRHPNDDRKPKYLYDSGGKVTLYGADHVDWKQPVLITEGELDTLVAWSNHIQAVSSTGGALSFQAEWITDTQFRADTPIYLCFDNDEAGAKGMVKTLLALQAHHLAYIYIVLIPDLPNVKDISDYVSHGGDLRGLLETAQVFDSTTAVEADMKKRKALWQSIHFHKAYLDHFHQDLHKQTYTPQSYDGNDAVLKAKSYPLTNLLAFTKRMALCPFHNEHTPSVHYYQKTNSAYCFGCGRRIDSIDMYQLKHHVDFKTAVKDLCGLV